MTVVSISKELISSVFVVLHWFFRPRVLLWTSNLAVWWEFFLHLEFGSCCHTWNVLHLLSSLYWCIEVFQARKYSRHNSVKVEISFLCPHHQQLELVHTYSWQWLTDFSLASCWLSLIPTGRLLKSKFFMAMPTPWIMWPYWCFLFHKKG